MKQYGPSTDCTYNKLKMWIFASAVILVENKAGNRLYKVEMLYTKFVTAFTKSHRAQIL